jgi:hypothetical protein
MNGAFKRLVECFGAWIGGYTSKFEVGIEFLFGDLRGSLSSMGKLARQLNTCSLYESTSKNDTPTVVSTCSRGLRYLLAWRFDDGRASQDENHRTDRIERVSRMNHLARWFSHDVCTGT